MAEEYENTVAEQIGADIKYVCKNIPRRDPGSEGEDMAADYFVGRLEEKGIESAKEKFTVFPAAHMSWTVVTVTCLILAYASYFFSSPLALLFILIGVVPYVLEFSLSMRAIDPLFKSKESSNVTATVKSKSEPKRKIYFVAHMDASPEWGLKYRLGSTLFQVVRGLNVAGILYLVIISIIRWAYVGAAGASIASGNMLYAGLAGLVFLIPYVMSFDFVSRKVISDGANDDLTGCFVALKALEKVSEQPLEDTEVGIILTGSGTCGLRGAKDWCDRHAAESKDNTMFVTLTTLRELDKLNICTHELVFPVRNSRRAVELVSSAAKRIDLKASEKRTPYGNATDSVAFTQAGLDSVSIMAVNRNLPDYFRTRYDSYDNISTECIGACYELALSIIDAYAGGDTHLLDGLAEEKAETAEEAYVEPSNDISSPDGEAF